MSPPITGVESRKLVNQDDQGVPIRRMLDPVGMAALDLNERQVNEHPSSPLVVSKDTADEM